MNYKKLFKTGIFAGGLVLALSSFASRILGVLRDRIIASKFGATGDLDAYFAAFRIPDVVYNLLILGAFSSAFIPIFTSYLAKGKKKEAFEIASTILNLTLIIILLVLGLVLIFTPSLVSVLGGFSTEQKELTVNLTRLLLLSPILFGLSNIFSGILNSFKKFVAYAFAPIIYNLGIIFGAYFLSAEYGIYGVVIGVIIGALGHLLVQIPSAVKLGFRYKPVLKLHRDVVKIGHLMLPRIFGLGMMQINLLVITVIASNLSEGSLTVFNFANNLQSFPIGIFGISLAVSSFPFLSEAASTNNSSLFQKHFTNTFGRICYFIIPVSLLMWLLREQIVRLVLGAGEFSWEATQLTSLSLGYFTFSLFAAALIALLARSFYAIQNTRTPVIISIVSMVVNIAGSLILSQKMGVAGLALAFSIATILQFLLLFIFLKLEMVTLHLKKLANRVLVIIVSTAIMGLVAWVLLGFTNNIFDLRTFMGVFMEASLVTIGSLLVYGFMTYIFRDEEIRALASKVFKK
ncbi:murein biosynthesis integral membrane protein MurJ [Patescibacteria group bacterium]|nr:murein biosynthesis integral membrane protein MurJ [Patescibacteria group bacterium]